jgi:zinc protease
VAGDIDTAAMLAMIRKYYGAYPHSPAPLPEIYTEEPAQSGPRRVTVRKPGELGTVIIAHKLPNARDPDQPALELLDAVLSSGKSSRLYHGLVDSGLALSADADVELHRDASLHTLFAQLAPGATHEQVEQALLAELDRIRTGGVTEAELARVKQQYVAATAYRRDGTRAIVSELNEWIAVGDWTLYVTFPEQIATVTAADVQRVAKKYFDDSQGTTGWFEPLAADEGKRP